MSLKGKAIILALCTLCYLVEYAMTPRLMALSACAPAAAQPAGSCCKDQCPKKQSKECDPTNDCCLNCPMCYLTLLPASPAQAPIAARPREYSVWTSSYVYLYHASCWKPPNAA